MIRFPTIRVTDGMNTPTPHEKSTMVTVIRAWLRRFGITPTISVLTEAMKREKRKALAESVSDGTMAVKED